ncbi:hypothetical protein COO60DRAFT_1510992 [Scenedesmus sp. NREL 46B-D3]|nr:hypothetical protein COO60DRAFT_1510992 [Scenedesmus sp. NREL 46B-D3]
MPLLACSAVSCYMQRLPSIVVDGCRGSFPRLYAAGQLSPIACPLLEGALLFYSLCCLQACVGSLLLGVTQMYQVRARLMHSANHVTGLLVNPCSSHAGELRRVVSLDSSMHCRRRCSNGVGVGVDALSICPPVEMQALLNFWTLVPSYAAHAIPF